MATDFPGYSHLLVATDFSPHAEAALMQAVWLARKHQAKITLAHIIPDLRRAVHYASYQAKIDLLQGDGDFFEREVRHESAERMLKMINRLGILDVNIRLNTYLGEPFVELTRAVQQDGYDLVLAGTRGLSPWEQFFVGSTAKRLIRKCPAPVWIAKSEHVGPPQSVLVASDFSEVSIKAVKQAIWIAKQADASIHLLHVIDAADASEDFVSKIPSGSTLRDEINAEATKRLDEFVVRLDANYEKFQSHLTWGAPWKEVGRIAKQVAADLVVLGTIGRSGIRGVLLGNTAEKVLGSCDCSILTVKPDDYVSPI